jgi:hypothetical protein
MNAWRWLISVLVSMSSHPDAIHDEAPKAAAAVAVAYARLPRRDAALDLTPELPSPKQPTVKPCRCGGACSPACTCGCHRMPSPAMGCSGERCKK